LRGSKVQRFRGSAVGGLTLSRLTGSKGFRRWLRLNLAIDVLGAPEGRGIVVGRVAGPRVR
jgi:hypothetical protein